MTSPDSLAAFVQARAAELGLRTGEHLLLTGASTAFAILLGVPLGIVASRVRWLRGPLTGTVGILQTIPSLAMLAILLVLLQRIGAVPAIVALSLYALLPIVRNTLAGLDHVSSEVREAARGIGMTAEQRLRLVEVPLAMPVIIAGVRTAAVVGVGIATLSAFIGAGGLGQFINRGLALSDTRLILLGAIPAAGLALVVDGSIAAFQWGLGRRRSGLARLHGALERTVRRLAVALPAGLAVAGGLTYVALEGRSSTPGGRDRALTVSVGTKNFTEQLILGELLAQLIAAHTDLRVERRFNLGGTMICHEALVSGGIDLYTEYTGTALTAVLGQPAVGDRNRVYTTVAREYRRRFAVEWLTPFGFDNTYAITVRRSDARSRGLRTISDLRPVAPSLRAGFTAEFSERPDGFPGLRRAYGLRFREVRDLDPALMYAAIADEAVDVICAFATDGRIPALDLQPLRDDLGFFPPYQAAPVVRRETLEAHPTLRPALERLAGVLDEAAMQRLNRAVDEEKRSPRDVARELLEGRGLLVPGASGLDARTDGRS